LPCNALSRWRRSCAVHRAPPGPGDPGRRRPPRRRARVRRGRGHSGRHGCCWPSARGVEHMPLLDGLGLACRAVAPSPSTPPGDLRSRRLRLRPTPTAAPRSWCGPSPRAGPWPTPSTVSSPAPRSCPRRCSQPAAPGCRVSRSSGGLRPPGPTVAVLPRDAPALRRWLRHAVRTWPPRSRRLAIISQLLSVVFSGCVLVVVAMFHAVIPVIGVAQVLLVILLRAPQSAREFFVKRP